MKDEEGNGKGQLVTSVGHAVARGSWLPALNGRPGFLAVTAAMGDAIVGIHEAILAAG